MRFFIFLGGVIIYLCITQIHNKLMMNDRVCFNANAYIHICMKICHIHPCSPLNKTFINSVKMGVVKRLLSMRKSLLC